MLLVLHGVGAFKIGVIIVLNWALVTWSVQRVRAGHAPAWLTPTLVWVLNGLTIFANDYYEGYSLKAIHPSLAPLVRFHRFTSSRSFARSPRCPGRIPTLVCSRAGM
jgi:hypothetical protein